eukprot:GHRQ01002107.1.p1 GENE.GHRQ01002107.1~~GHRQ01002107.1.p1  ORF type:complete len:341 (+),score=96.59 GHRQ01002107.1:283-1305(+)
MQQAGMFRCRLSSNQRLIAAAPHSASHRCVHAAAGKGFGTLKPSLKKSSAQQTDYWNGREPLKMLPITPMRLVPPEIKRPPYANSGKLPPVDRQPQMHTPEGLVKMRAACKLAAEVLSYAGTLALPGVSTDEIDRAVHEMIVHRGAYPSPLNYGKFPKSVCTSVNEVMCHGIPDSRQLQEGDIINIDVTVYLDGYHGDTSRTFFVHDPEPNARRLVEANEEALQAAIKVCGPGVPLSAIGAACADVAQKHKFTVVRDFIGHGVGTVFHAAPEVLHHRNTQSAKMQVNQTFTIEPIFVEGSNKSITWKDDWTATTIDGGLAAQCEHTILITPDGHEILTVV